MSLKSATLSRETYAPSSRAWLGALITWRASKQAFFTLGLFADPGKRFDALRAYAYFRWVDDQVDARSTTAAQRRFFITRQKKLISFLKRSDSFPLDLVPEEQMLADLMGKPYGRGLEIYVDKVMAVLEFDAGRRGKLISQTELDRYMRDLATGVTEALYCFLGGGHKTRRGAVRYAAATGAHVVHMLRDAYEDVEFGYFNVPKEYLQAHHLDSTDVTAPAMRAWVRQRIALAKRLFRTGRADISRLKSFRLRLAGYAYIARFEILLATIEREGYQLRPAYPDRKNLSASLSLIASVLRSALAAHTKGAART